MESQKQTLELQSRNLANEIQIQWSEDLVLHLMVKLSQTYFLKRIKISPWISRIFSRCDWHPVLWSNQPNPSISRHICLVSWRLDIFIFFVLLLTLPTWLAIVFQVDSTDGVIITMYSSFSMYRAYRLWLRSPWLPWYKPTHIHSSPPLIPQHEPFRLTFTSCHRPPCCILCFLGAGSLHIVIIY